MVGNEIKSFFRNKANIIYIILFVIVSIIINISININNIINKYYDNQMQKNIPYNIDEDNFYPNLNLTESEISTLRFDQLESYRIIGLTMAYPLDDETIEKIQKIKHVQEVKKMEIFKEVEIFDADKKNTFKDTVAVDTNRILVDDWQNCNYVQKELNKLGIENYFMGQEDLINSYSTVSKYSRIVSYFAIIISIIILILSCKNIIKNEEENNKLLNILGYTHRKIKNIIFIQLAVIISIGFILGITMSNIIMLIFNNIIM